MAERTDQEVSNVLGAMVDVLISTREKYVASMKQERWYISGPMTGYVDYNHANFASAAKRLRKQGRIVISPHEHDQTKEIDFSQPMSAETRAHLLAWDIAALTTCHGAYFLYAWELSSGARLEHHIARELGLKIEYECGPSSSITTTYS